MTRYAYLFLLLVSVLTSYAQVSIDVPVLDGEWWQIAEREPDVGRYNNPKKHNACDFTIWQAADGTWQLAACIRDTTYPGATRLFYRWESQALTNAMWVPQGIFATSNPDIGQVDGVMQAPHCFKSNGKYYFFYNAAYKNERGQRQGNAAYCKISDDGKTFSDLVASDGSYRFFDMGRDLMIYQEKDIWYAYFEYRGKMSMRTSLQLDGPWSRNVTSIGHSGNPESPFLIKRGETYYLWEQMKVFASSDPTDFSAPPIAKMTPGPTNGKYAPEILCLGGTYYIAAYDSGIWLCKMRWEKRTMDEIKAWRTQANL